MNTQRNTDIKRVSFICTGITVFGRLVIRRCSDGEIVRSEPVCVSEQTAAGLELSQPAAD